MGLILLVFCSALALEGLGSYISIVGLAAKTSMIMVLLAITFDVSKIVVASVIYKRWRTLPIGFKLYLVPALIVLMGFTSYGAFGYISQEYGKTVVQQEKNTAQIELLEREQAKLEDRKKQLDKQFADLPAESVVQRRRLNELYGPELARINPRIEELDKEIPKLKTESINEAGNNGTIGAYAKNFNLPVEKVITLISLIIVFVLDPLAIAMVSLGNFLFEERKTKLAKLEEDKKKERLAEQEKEQERQDRLLLAQQAVASITTLETSVQDNNAAPLNASNASIISPITTPPNNVPPSIEPLVVPVATVATDSPLTVNPHPNIATNTVNPNAASIINPTTTHTEPLITETPQSETIAFASSVQTPVLSALSVPSASQTEPVSTDTNHSNVPSLEQEVPTQLVEPSVSNKEPIELTLVEKEPVLTTPEESEVSQEESAQFEEAELEIDLALEEMEQIVNASEPPPVAVAARPQGFKPNFNFTKPIKSVVVPGQVVAKSPAASPASNPLRAITKTAAPTPIAPTVSTSPANPTPVAPLVKKPVALKTVPTRTPVPTTPVSKSALEDLAIPTPGKYDYATLRNSKQDNSDLEDMEDFIQRKNQAGKANKKSDDEEESLPF